MFFFDDKFSKVPYMLNGEVRPHFNGLVTHNSESATDKRIDIDNT